MIVEELLIHPRKTTDPLQLNMPFLESPTLKGNPPYCSQGTSVSIDDTLRRDRGRKDPHGAFVLDSFFFACTLYWDQQPSVEQPEHAEPPAEIQDITPRKEEVHGEDPVNRDEEEEKDASEAELMHFLKKDSGLEADLQELSVAKTQGEGGDCPDVREEFASNIEPVEMPEAVTQENKDTEFRTKEINGAYQKDQHPNVEQPQQEEPPAEIQDITPRKEEVHGEDPVNRDEEEEKDASEDSGLEADFQELSVAKTGGEGGDGPDVREEFASNIEPVEMPEAEQLDEIQLSDYLQVTTEHGSNVLIEKS
ncbi:hypothetical protein JEQ12_019957 [Ovis aries]|uniref:GAGE domain-containing protein n=1 Tax=Ovis aries TaxID=9940 RepID=A0A835ZH01_SHEEP|nr:hypothetical protein JEQ12_019957 [Ovis aries]